VFGRLRRHEKKARANEWVFSFRDEIGAWDALN